MGIVHLAEARGPGGFEKLVVIKELKPELEGDPVYAAMFLDEARLAARLSHRHIVQTNEVGCSRGRYFMALELLEGGSLQQIRAKLGLRSLPLPLGLRILVAVLDALEHAHALTDDEGASLGVVHRDVSPQNVFVTFSGEVKLIDFGVAKSRGRRGAAAVTRVGVVKGSVPYMSPDHVDGSVIDRRADVFAVGVLLREMLLGERLWEDVDDLGILRALIAKDLPAFPERDDVPSRLRAIAVRAMAPARDDRFASAAAMRDALRTYLTETDTGGSLEDLGPWLSQALAEERVAFQKLVRASRAATAPVAGHTKSQVWLPSSELQTRYSGPPALPARAKGPVAALRPSLARWLGPALVIAVSVAISVLSFTHRGPAPTLSARAPRVADTALTESVETGAIREASKAPDEPAAESVPPSEQASVSQLPASVLRESLPPNPYDPGE